MEIGSGIFVAMTLGFLLGMKHATDADHVVAVSTIAREFGNAWRGIWVGVSWGLGHTTPLLVLGVAILVLKETVLDRYEAVAPVLEFGVGVMLVFLGLQVLWNLRRGNLHLHAHTHKGQGGDAGEHVHIHATHPAVMPAHQERLHGLWHLGRPTFRLKSYLIGIVHGMAGSAAVMLVLLPEVSSFGAGLAYLLLFGLGTMLSMAAITVVLGVPFAVTARLKQLDRTVAGLAGGASLVFGVALMSDIAFGTALIPF